ncbi:hypothetical protein [Streptomyces sp. NPDC004270]
MTEDLSVAVQGEGPGVDGVPVRRRSTVDVVARPVHVRSAR